MSVYTSISDCEFSEILKNYSLGELTSAEGIQAGIENTNYFVSTTKGEYVFTLFEKIDREELTFYISLLRKLSVAGISCPQPQTDKSKQTINEIKSKPFILVSRLKGKNITTASLIQCTSIATELANFHSATSLTVNPENNLLQNRRGKTWREATAKKLMKKLSHADALLLKRELACYRLFDDSKLPKGIIHADLFKDNALFEKDQLTGIIDFYDACYDNYLYDIAITVNDWCTDENGKLVDSLASAFLQSYQSIRILSDEEVQSWPIILRMAALRFWLSRLEDALILNIPSSQQGTLTHRKDPEEYRRILINHIGSDVTAMAAD